MAKPGKTPTKFSPKMNKTPKGGKPPGPVTPKMKSATPGKKGPFMGNKSPNVAASNGGTTPKFNGAQKQQKKPITPRAPGNGEAFNTPKSFNEKQQPNMNKSAQKQQPRSEQKMPKSGQKMPKSAQKAPVEQQQQKKPVESPKQQQPQQPTVPKMLHQRPVQQQRQIDNSNGKPSSLKPEGRPQAKHGKFQHQKQQDHSAEMPVKKESVLRTVRLTFGHGQLRSVEQVKQLAPTAVSIKFPNVVFAEFESETEAERVRTQLQVMVNDGQLSQVSFMGDKERQFQTNQRSLDHTTLFVHGVAGASEADIKRLFPTCTTVTLRTRSGAPGGNQQYQQKSYCFVSFSSEQVCKTALDKSKGLTLFGRPLVVNYAFAKADAQKRSAQESSETANTAVTSEALVPPPSKKAKPTTAVASGKQAVSVKTALNEDDEDDDDDEDMEDEEDDVEDEEDDEADDGEDQDDDDDLDDEDDDEGDDDEDDEDDEEDE